MLFKIRGLKNGTLVNQSTAYPVKKTKMFKNDHYRSEKILEQIVHAFYVFYRARHLTKIEWRAL